MYKKSSERLRVLLESKKIPKLVWIIILIALAAFAGFGFLINTSSSNAGSTSLPGNNLISTTGLFFNITLKLSVVLLIIYVFMKLLNRWQGTRQESQKKYLSVVETTYLNPHQSLHLVKAGDKLLLLGSTDQSITCLTELDDAALIPEPCVEKDNTPSDKPNLVHNFASILAQNFSKH
ncbi:MAG: flagellar biosynthetic protein FliO [Anaerolineaceae bacterium]